MLCPACRSGRLACRSTREAATPGRTLRYRKCAACGHAAATLETILRIRPVLHIDIIPRNPVKQAGVTIL